MELVHSVWENNNFYIWVETLDTLFGRSKQPDGRKDIANSTYNPNARSFKQILKILQIAGLEDIASKKVEVSTIDVVFPNNNWSVDALVIPPLETMDFLLEQIEKKSDYFSLGDSTSFWMDVAQFVLNIISKEKFLPYIHVDKSNSLETNFHGKWKALLDSRDESKIVAFSKIFIDRKLDETLDYLEVKELILSFINTLLDSFVRNKLGVFLPKSRRSDNSSTSVIARDWFQSLYDAEEKIITYPTNEFDVFYGTLNAWLNKTTPQQNANPFRLCLKLTPPNEEEALDLDRDFWKLEYLLQAQNDPSLLVSARDIWNSKTGVIKFLEKRFENPQERLLVDLGDAMKVYPKLEESLQTAFPTQLYFEKDGAFDFLQNYSPILEEQGFGVLLPAWWSNPPKDVDVSLKANPKSEGTKTNTGIFRLNSFLNFEWEIAINGTQLSIEEFERLAELRVPFVKIRGQWIKIDKERINQMLDLIKNKYKRKRLTNAEALQLSITEDLEDDPLFDLEMEEESTFQNFTNRIGASSKINLLETPKGFEGELRPYQIEGFSWLNFLQDFGFGACLADDMGLGKTIQIIAFLLHKKNKAVTDLNPSLLICPTSIVGNWQREINRFAPGLTTLIYHGPERHNNGDLESLFKSYDIVITTYNLAQRDFPKLNAIKWHNIILDEAQNIKNPHTKQTRAIKKLESKFKIALTGTPIENRLSELWSIMDFLNPGYLSNLKAFKENYIQPIEKNLDKNKIRHLSQIIQPFILRRLKTDKSIINDLPEKMEYNVFCSLTEEQAILYEAVIKDLFEQLNFAEGIQRKGLVLATITKLKQICNHPAQFTHEGMKKLQNRSCKFERLEEMLEEVFSNKEKALIFTQYKELGKMLQVYLKKKFGFEPLFLSGDTSLKNREKIIQKFQDESPKSPQLFILSIKAGGVGLNLTSANHVFHIDRWWNPAVENQATDRAFRIGQKKNVMVHKFVCIGTLEESIDQLIKQKIGLANSIISTGDSYMTELSIDDLRNVLTLRTIH